MKKLSVFFLLLALLTVGCLALEDSSQSVSVTYDRTEGLIKAEISVLTGDAIVGHFGLSYNPQKLTLVASDGSAVPTTVPEKSADGKSFLSAVVQAAGEHIVVTTESNKAADLIRPSAGKVLFGWYATKSVESVTPTLENGKIAVLRFKLVDGVTPSDLTNTDLAPVSNADCAGISGWSNGIIVINSQSKIFTYAAVEGTTALKIAVTADFSSYPAANPTDPAETPPEKEPTPAEPDKEPEPTDPEPAEPDKEPEPTDPQPSEPAKDVTETSENVDFGLQAHAYAEKIRFLWTAPSVEIESFSLLLTDTNGQTVRRLENLVGITQSATVSALAPDYPLTATLTAYTADGKELVGKALSVRTDAPDANVTPVAFTVTYDAGIGEFYGFDSEEVLFGTSPTKAPTVYAPDGYEFAGWSLDGENTVPLTETRVYEDCRFIAVFSVK